MSDNEHEYGVTSKHTLALMYDPHAQALTRQDVMDSRDDVAYIEPHWASRRVYGSHS